MSFNYLEVARAAATIQALLPARIESIELLEFPLSLKQDRLGELCVGLKLVPLDESQDRFWFALSLKAPWIGAFAAPLSFFRPSRTSASGTFRGVYSKMIFALKNAVLRDVEAAKDDRILTLRAGKDVTLEAHLFGARPNLILSFAGESVVWREDKAAAPKEENSPMRPGMHKPLVLREFGEDWMAGAYQHYLELRKRAAFEALQRELATRAESRVARLSKLRAELNESLLVARQSARVKEAAEFMKEHLYEWPKGANAESKAKLLELKSQFRLGTVSVEFKPEKSLAENAALLFDRYKKLVRSNEELGTRVQALENEAAKTRTLVGQLRGFKREEGEDYLVAHQRLEAFAKKLGAFEILGLDHDEKEAVPSREKKLKKAAKSGGVRVFKTKEGLVILAGRTHTENEQVVKMANGNDLWFHLKGRPSAHVIIQVPKKRTASLESLLDAANLVTYYSGVRSGDKVDVDYTFRKFVKRVAGKGASQDGKFLVTYSQNKTLVIKLEQTRLDRLLAQTE